jgi:putative ABC transport system permease protein
MLKNYLKIAIRNLSRYKLFSFINIFGLALSMSICLIVMIHLREQLNYDKFHPYPGRTYRIITEITNKQGSGFRFASSPLPFATALASNYDLIERSARIYAPAAEKAVAGKKELTVNAAFTEPAFLDIFGFKLKTGNEHSALTQPNSIVLNRETAEKFFGGSNAVGQIVDLPRLGNFQVTGVLDKPAGKSHIDFDAYLSMSSVPQLEKSGKLPPVLDQWNATIPAYTYVLLKKGASKKQLDKAVAQLSATLLRDSKSKLTGKESFAFEVQPFNKIILGEELNNSIGNIGSTGKMLAEVLIGFIILLSACFNFTNLSIARSLNRGKEVGIRKVSGASRYQVFGQFIFESVFISFLSLGFAYVLLRLMIDHAPFIDEIISLDFSFDGGLFLWFTLFTLFTGLLAGMLPAWVLSSFKPVEVLKNLSNIKLFGSNNFRKMLIIVQFILALVITIFTTIASRQFSYMANADPGYNRDNLLVVPLQGADRALLTAEIGRLSGVQNVAASSGVFGGNSPGSILAKLQADKEPIKMDFYDVDRNFIATMGLQLSAGQNFPGDINEKKEQFVIANETAARTLGFKTAAEVIGKTIVLNDSTEVQVAGVMKDFHFQSLAVPLSPLLLRYRPQAYNLLLVKTTVISKTLPAEIAAIWRKTNPMQEFKSSWLKEELYERQSAWGTVSMLGFLAFMTITIACLGLLGMVIYNTETRRKEIGIRKVMGASVATIIGLLSKSFLKLVVIAGLIALPIGYVCGFLFLNIFANRVQMGFVSLVFSFLGLLLIVMITISSQILKVATANPVNSLRSE